MMLNLPSVRAAVERRAYGLWEARGRPVGDHLSDWLAAEEEVIVRPIEECMKNRLLMSGVLH